MPISAAGNNGSRPEARVFAAVKRSAERGFIFMKRSAEHGFTSARRSAEHGFTSARRSAEHGFTSARRSAEHGFTLIELMVVITIIGLASAAVVLAMPDPRGRLSDQADRFAARVRVAHDMAILDGRTTSVWIAPGGYGFDLRTRDGWQPIPDKALRVAQWGKDVRPAFAGDGRQRVIFDSTGLADQPLDLRLTRDGASVTVHIGAGGEVRVDG